MGVIIVEALTEKLVPGLPGLKFTSVYPQTYPPCLPLSPPSLFHKPYK